MLVKMLSLPEFCHAPTVTVAPCQTVGASVGAPPHTNPNDLDAPLRIAAKSKIDDYREQSEH
jgi:hypothetical protein